VENKLIISKYPNRLQNEGIILSPDKELFMDIANAKLYRIQEIWRNVTEIMVDYGRFDDIRDWTSATITTIQESSFSLIQSLQYTQLINVVWPILICKSLNSDPSNILVQHRSGGYSRRRIYHRRKDTQCKFHWIHVVESFQAKRDFASKLDCRVFCLLIFKFQRILPLV